MSQFYDQASLVMVPSGYKSGKIYSQKPLSTSGELSFSRASNATRVNSSGLVERVRTNEARYSEDQTNWTDQNETSVTANTAANPLNGAVTADKVVPSVIPTDHYRGLSMATLIGEFSVSIYVKADGYDFFDFGVYNSTALAYAARATFDLSTATYSLTSGTSASITSVGSGWYRVSMLASVASSSALSIYHRVRPTGGTGVYSGDGTSGMLLWGYQLESGVLTPYIGPTTSTSVSVGPVSGLPRLDYSGGASCPSALLEPQRTNVCQWSEQIDNAGWGKTNAPTITTNIATAPDGYGGADGIQDTTGGTFKRIRQNFSVTPNQTHTASVFVKKETSETNYGGLALVFTNRWVYGIIDAVNGTITVSSDSIIASSSTKVEDYGTYWRFSLTVTDNQSNTSLEIAYYATLSTNGTSTGLGAGSVRTLWGFQLELGASYVSSYIPTLSSAVTRVADSASKTGIASLIGQSEGTIFLDFVYNGIQNLYANLINSEKNTTNSFYIHLGLDGIVRAGIFANSVQRELTASGFVVGQRYKLAFAYKTGELAIYSNGVQKATSTATFAFTSSLDDIFLNDVTTYFGYQENISFNQTLLFTSRLSNADLATLTTL